MPAISKNSVNYLSVDEAAAGQRLDNFLIRLLKGVPKSHIHRIIRGGIVFEDEHLLVVDKPSGVAVHGGSGVSFGVIEQLRRARPQARYLELVHRLDKDTSGLLMVAKKRSALVKLHEAWRNDKPKKVYLALGMGAWPQGVRQVKHAVGLSALSLMEATLRTGRTHQIRVHMQSQNCPIAGDERYGDYTANRRLKKLGLKRMFLHAHRLELEHPASGETLVLTAPLPEELRQMLEGLRQGQEAT